jgi:hypothetical protein
MDSELNPEWRGNGLLTHVQVARNHRNPPFKVDKMPYKGKQRLEYEKKRRDNLRTELIEMLGGGCVVCGTSENLEFHHINSSEKKFKISTMLCWNKQRVILEALKCELRCRDHHIEVHYTPLVHGTRGGYRRGCRCDACLSAKRDYMNNWQNNHRASGKDKTRKNYAQLLNI